MKGLLYINGCMRKDSRTELLGRKYIEHILKDNTYTGQVSI